MIAKARLAAVIVGGSLFVLYFQRLAPTVGTGDVADLQAQTALLGVAHSPGYILQILAGKLFLLLTPARIDAAYRLNLFTAACGVATCLLLYAAVYTITKDIMAACWAAIVLGLSSSHWGQSIASEVYVFHSLFIAVAVLCLALHAGTGRLRHLYGACLSLGIAVAGRPSEAFILPAFVPAFALAYGGRRRKPRELLVSLCLFLAPFVLSVGYFLALHNTRALLTEDERAVERIVEAVEGGDQRPGKSLLEALHYCLGLKWLDRFEKPKPESRISRARKYCKLLTGQLHSGVGRGSVSAERLGGNQTSVGPAALTVAVAAILLPGGPWPWLLCGLGLFLGNLAFYLWYPQPGGLAFVIPSIIGLSFLAGMGAHKIGRRGRWPRIATAILLVAVASSLYITNHSFSSAPTPLEQGMSVEEAKEIPYRSILIADYQLATRYRYIVQVAADRRDVQILRWEAKRKASLVQKLRSTGRPVFVLASRPVESAMETPPALAKYKFRRVH
jgi:hypothetical protein